MTPLPVGAAATVAQVLEKAGEQSPEERLKEATTLFESAFYQELFKVMRDTVPEGSTSGSGEDVFTSMLDQHVAGKAAAQQDDGLAAALYRKFVEFVR
ncbi:MAG: hypothetical protein HKO53_16245 [Gemmatimonadetes bacterium]|nr:hypothetical protein [Gemmatimonadota bacterium]